MSLIILQPFGNKDAREHYENTIKKKVNLSTISRYVDADLFEAIQDYYTDSEVPVWGVTPGKNDVNKRKWDKVQSGDIVLFSAKKLISIAGTVVFKIHNKDLANYLWGEDLDNQTWEYIYLLDELKALNIAVEDFNNIAGYKPKNIIQGFSVLNEEKSEALISHFELFSDRIIEDVSEDEYNKTLDSFDTLDKKVLTSARKEQQFLRKQLFNNNQRYKCSICGKIYPIEFLVASHIKKRSLCTINEQKDWKNIVMPMCRFGCDELYEKGYIGVVNGKVKSFKTDNTDLLEYLNMIEGRSCKYWNNNTKAYFEFHNRQSSSMLGSVLND